MYELVYGSMVPPHPLRWAHDAINLADVLVVNLTDIVPAPPLVNRVLSLIRMLKLRDKHGMGMTFVFQTKSLVRFYALLIIMRKSNRLIRQRLKHYQEF